MAKMIDVRKDFEDSFHLLLHQKKIIIPIFCSIALPLILIFLFLNLSGIAPLIKELSIIKAGFDEQKTDYLMNTQNLGEKNYTRQLINYIGRESDSSEYNKELALYFKDRGYDWNRYLALLNIQNLILLIVLLALGIFGSFYFSCMSYAIIALAIKKQPISLNNVGRVTNRFFLKLVSLRIILTFIFWAPLLIIIAIIVSLFFLNVIIGAMSIVLFVVLFLVYLVYIGLRLYFATPYMYIEEKGPLKTLKHSFHLTKGHLFQVFIIFLILLGISFFANSFISQPLYESYTGFLFSPDSIKITLNFIILALFLLLESFVFTFQHLFLFYAYVEFKELKELVK